MHTMKLTAPIDRWDEAIPLGNGLMGTLLWGEGSLVRLSLDRGDMWDLRPIPEFQKSDSTWQTLVGWVREGKQSEIVKRFDDPYNGPYPTKIPAGRLELTLDRGVSVETFALDAAAAVGSATWGRGGGAAKGKGSRQAAGNVRVFCDANSKAGLAWVQGSGVKVRLKPAAFGGKVTATQGNSLNTGDLANLGYPPPKLGRDGDIQWSLQHGVDAFAFAIVVGTRDLGKKGTLIAYTVTCTNDGPDPVAIGRRIVSDALARGFDATLKAHRAWWRQFWSTSRVTLPDRALQEHYDLVRYFYGAASRRGAPPIPLQGVWTADEGKLPPWKGDYHHDLNTQLTYWAYLGAGHFDEGLCFLEYLWNLLPRGRQFARQFYGTPGMCLPGVAALDGQPLGGWSQYTLLPGNTIWLAQAFHWHWRYTMDADFLRDRAYPWCVELARCVEALLEKGDDGKLRFPISASPEVHDNSAKAWMKPNTNYDIALLRWFFAALAEMADALKESGEAAHWRDVLGQIEELHIKKDGPWQGVLMLSAEEILTETHRHHSHLMAIHPLGVLHVEGSDADRGTIARSLAQIDTYGPGYWVGFSFTWLACMAARAGQPEKARMMLELFVRGFISRNGFHINGDYKNQGLSAFKYRPFTLEANFAAATSVHEMLLQGWGGVLRVFPAVSKEWMDVRFEKLRAEGGWTVSATRRAGHTVEVRVRAAVDSMLRLRDPFGGTKAKWNRRGVKREGKDLVIALQAGEELVGRV